MKKILILIAGVIFFSGCSNDWLEVAEPHDGSVTPNVVYANEKTVTNAIIGTLDLMKEYYYDRHVTVGVRFYTLGLDWMGNDMVSNPGQWWTYESQWNTMISGIVGAYQSNYYWYMFYRIINDVNTKIVAIEDDSCPISADLKASFVAELTAIRGYCYHQLVRVFSKAYLYSTPASDLGVPIYTTPTDATREGNDRATIAEVYTQVLADLDAAAAVLTANSTRPRTEKFRIDKNVVLGWRANVHLDMGSWAAAAADAAAVKANFSTLMTSAQYYAGFNDISVSEWIWGFPFQADQALGYASLFSHLDLLRPQAGYKNFFINDDFVSLFSATDMRNIFFNAYSAPAWAYWSSRKFRDNADACGDWGMMRSSEMYLIEAEGLLNSGKATEAHNVLYALQKHRDPSAVKSTNTGQALLDEILVERRKELYAEIGLGFLDLKRYNKPMVRTGNHALSHTFTVPAGASQWLFGIPQAEFDRNKNIKTNNPRSDDRVF